MAWKTLLLTLTVLGLCVSAQAQQECAPSAEEGTEYTVTNPHFGTPDKGRIIEWQVDDKTVYSSDRLDEFPSIFRATDPPSGLTILNVSREAAATYRCIIGAQESFSCRLSVYKRPATPTCTVVTVHNDDTITTSCTTEKTFPAATCQFSLNATDIISSINYSNERLPGDPEYYKTTCDLQYSVLGLAPGTHSVHVTMYPSGVGLTSAHGVSSQVMNFTLSIPTVQVTSCLQGKNIIDGYVKSGTTATCTCMLDHPGVPEGSIKWSETLGTTFAVLSSTRESSTIQMQSEGTYRCQGEHRLDSHVDVIDVEVPYARGPSTVTISRNSSNINLPIDKCSNEVTVSVYCAVNKNDVEPAITEDNFTMTVSEGNVTSPTGVTFVDTGTEYRRYFTITVTSAGVHSVTCTARNPKFGDIHATNTLQITVREPPASAPSLEARSDQHGEELREDDRVSVTCTVVGGYPPVEKVILTCGETTLVTSSGASVSLNYNKISLKENGTECTCDARHATQCYSQIGKLVLTVTEKRRQESNETTPGPSLSDRSSGGGSAGGSSGGNLLMATIGACLVGWWL